MSNDDYREVKVIKADGKYIYGVFTGINLPVSQWELNFTNQPHIALVYRPTEPLLSMLEVTFPDVKFSTERIKKFMACGCSIATY